MGNSAFIKFILTKNFKKIQQLAFTDKVKTIKSSIPEKVKIFIENSFNDEIKYFQKKYSIKVELLTDSKMIIPEYKIELLNKSKKTINVFEKTSSMIDIKKVISQKKISKKEIKKDKKEIKKDKKKTKVKKKVTNIVGKKEEKKLNYTLHWGTRLCKKIFFHSSR